MAQDVPPIFPRVDNPAVVVIGGANVDQKCQTLESPVLGTSNPGRIRVSAGGVARNVAENLARLGITTALITPIGDDADGSLLLRDTEAAGVDLRHIVPTDLATGHYTAILDDAGEMIVAISAMDAMSDITHDVVDARRALIANARVLMLDCNVPEDALVRAAEHADNNAVMIIIDPVSVPKTRRIVSILTAGYPVHTITPNLDELHELTGATGSSRADLCNAAARLHASGVSNVWIRLGANGSFLSSAQEGGPHVQMIAAAPATLVDATGAGDAMLAGYIAGLLKGLDPFASARYGRAAAAITVESPATVNPAINLATLVARAGASAEAQQG